MACQKNPSSEPCPPRARGGQATLFQKDEDLRVWHNNYGAVPLTGTIQQKTILFDRIRGSITEEGIHFSNGFMMPRLDQPKEPDQRMTSEVRAKLHAVAILGTAAFRKEVFEEVKKSYDLLSLSAGPAMAGETSLAPACAGSIEEQVPEDWAKLPVNDKKPHIRPKGSILLIPGWGPFRRSIPDLYADLMGSKLCKAGIPSAAEMTAFGYLDKLVQIEIERRLDPTASLGSTSNALLRMCSLADMLFVTS